MHCTAVLFCNCLPRLLSRSTGTPKLFILCHIISNQKPSRDTTSKWFVHQQEYSGMHLQIARKKSKNFSFFSYIFLKLLSNIFLDSNAGSLYPPYCSGWAYLTTIETVRRILHGTTCLVDSFCTSSLPRIRHIHVVLKNFPKIIFKLGQHAKY